MAEGVLFSIAEGIIRSLSSEAVKKLEIHWGVKDELEKLKNVVSTLKAVLLDAEEQQAGSHEVKDWLENVNDSIYDADDLLDDFSTESLRREIMQGKKVRVFFSKSNQLFYALKMGHKIKEIRQKLAAYEANRRFSLEVRHGETRLRNRERDNTHSFVRAEEVIGREDDKKAVIERLMASDVEENVSILSIVGIGGLGKTTLAQLIFNDVQIQKHFQLKMWVCVSDPFDVQKIFAAATEMMLEGVGQMETLARKLKEKIDEKRYLLVLDDVWNEDREKWSCLKVVLMGGARGSRIVVTTRNEKVASTIRCERVAKIIKTVESYSLRGLDDGESWSLFKQMAFENGQEPENSSIVKLGKEILQKCSGVPLAIRTIGSLLGCKNPETWLSFKNNELSKISDQNETDILPTLKLSYDNLPSHLKHCFAYCRLFPKDYVIERSTLIQRWIAQGFVKIFDQKQCLEDVGNQYFMDLLWRSFFQEAITDGFGIVYRCKMHDLMHDLAISVAGSMITTLDAKERNVDEKTRHVSVVRSDIDALSVTTSSVVRSDIDALSVTTSLCKARSIRTLLSFYTSEPFGGESDCKAIFSSCKFLRVLELHNRLLDILPSSIGKLKHLRYLDLSNNNNLKKLPNSITRLQNLQTLILSNCGNLEELPRDIRKLVNLRHLEIDTESQLTYMPRGLGQLTNLQTLSYFVVHKDPLSRQSSGLKELKGLNNLRGELCIKNLRHGKDVASECKAANLKEKKHLHGLDLQWSSEGGGNDSDVNVDDEVLLLEDLQLQPNLKRLRLEGNFCSRLPTWLLSLTNLVRFELDKCTKCQYLPPLSQLSSLKHLSLSNLDALEYISDSNEFSSSSSASVAFFPSLYELSLISCYNLKGWWRRRDSSVEVNSDLLPSFRCLSKLFIRDCPMLTSMPMFPHLEKQLFLDNASLKPVQQTMMMNMAAQQSPTSTATASSSSTPLSKLKHVILDSIADLATLPEELLKNLTSLKFLIIWRCKRLNSLSPAIQHLTALQRLELTFCPEFEVANDEDGMQWQGLKSLLSLKFYDLPKLVSLPLGLQHATTLQRLILHCENLTEIPEWIHNYTSLQVLEIGRCSRLTSLPKGLHSLTSLQRLKIRDCPILLQRCEREGCEDWPKIAHIPELDLENSNSDAEVDEPAKAQKKQRIWSILKKSRALNS